MMWSTDCHTYTPLPMHTHAQLHVYRRGNLSSDDTVNWSIQTFLVGFTSLFLLKDALKGDLCMPDDPDYLSEFKGTTMCMEQSIIQVEDH